MRQILIAAAAMAISLVSVRPVSAVDDSAEVRQAIRKLYSVFSQELDKQKYRSLVTDDYLLLEHGDVLDIEGDVALMPTPDSGYQRTDEFDFRSVKVHGDMAYAVYLLRSDITDKKNGNRKREFLESAILRRIDGNWRVALLHSTRKP